MRRLNNLVTLFSAMFAFFFGCFLSTMLTNIEKCSKKSTLTARSSENHDNEMFLIVLILSAPNYFERREVIRNTWLQLGYVLKHDYYPEDFLYLPDYNNDGFMEYERPVEQENRLGLFKDWMSNVVESTPSNRRFIHIKHFFVIGTNGLSSSVLNQLNKEQRTNEDLILMKDLKDSYSNLTLKLVKSIEYLVDEYNFNYILKTDDDTYVKLDFLLNELVSYDRKLTRKMEHSYKDVPPPELYWGFFNGRAQIKKRGQWKEDNFYLCDRYVTYALGGGYVFSRNIAEFVHHNSKVLNMYVSEDVSFGVWTSLLRNVYRRHDVRFDTGYMPRKCKNYHIVLHKRSIEQMNDLYEGNLCTFEAQNENVMKRPAEFYYNWKQTADKCCDTLV